MNLNTRCLRVFILLIVVFFIFSSRRSLAQSKVRFPVSVASKTVGFSPIWAVTNQGFFDRQGLQVEVVLMRGAEKAALALVGESVYVGLGSADAFVTAVESNYNVSIIGGIINRPSFFIMAR